MSPSEEDKTCFVIAPIGDPESDIRKQSDQVLRHIIAPAVSACGYKPVRADGIDKPGMITSQVIQHVVNDPLVVADLTGRNPNVFYELAIRHAIRKPLVQLITKGERIPFDVAGARTIHFDLHDLDSAKSAGEEIVKQVKALEADASDMETPISVSLDLQLLRQSENPEDRSLADLVSMVSDVRSSLGKMETKIGSGNEAGVLDEIQQSLKHLPRLLERQFEGPNSSAFSGPRRRLNPMFLRELISMSMESGEAGIPILIVASMFRESAPWIHELGMEAYRLIRSGKSAEAHRFLETFQSMAMYSIHGPGREFIGKDRNLMMLAEEIEPLIDFQMRELGRKSRRAKAKRPPPSDERK